MTQLKFSTEMVRHTFSAGFRVDFLFIFFNSTHTILKYCFSFKTNYTFWVFRVIVKSYTEDGTLAGKLTGGAVKEIVLKWKGDKSENRVLQDYELVDGSVNKFGTLDIMVNNAGIAEPPCPDIREFPLSLFEKVFDVNAKGTFVGMKHAAQIMIPLKKGSIISISSVGGAIGELGPHAYTGSKHAVLGLTKSVAAELGKHGIRVNCVSPYAVLTNLAMAHVPEDERTEDAFANFRAHFGRQANLQGVDFVPEDDAGCF